MSTDYTTYDEDACGELRDINNRLERICELLEKLVKIEESESDK